MDRESTKPVEQILCLCGCGILIDKYDRQGRERRLIQEHAIRINRKNITPLSLLKMAQSLRKRKGDNIKYGAIHCRIKQDLPKPDECPTCHRKVKLELSNISGKYLLDLNDWEWSCAKCHHIFDNRYTKIGLKRKGVPWSDNARKAHSLRKISGYKPHKPYTHTHNDYPKRILCKHCSQKGATKNGLRGSRQRWKCQLCKRRFTTEVNQIFII